MPPSFERLYLSAAREARLPLTVHRMPVGSASMLTPRFHGEPTGSGPSVAPVGPTKLFLDGGERCALCFSLRQVVQVAATTLRRAIGGGGLAAVRVASQQSGFRRGPDGLLHQGILFWEQDALDSAVRDALRPLGPQRKRPDQVRCGGFALSGYLAVMMDMTVTAIAIAAVCMIGFCGVMMWAMMRSGRRSGR